MYHPSKGGGGMNDSEFFWQFASSDEETQRLIVETLRVRELVHKHGPVDELYDAMTNYLGYDVKTADELISKWAREAMAVR
jgi:hypothetical protein